MYVMRIKDGAARVTANKTAFVPFCLIYCFIVSSLAGLAEDVSATEAGQKALSGAQQSAVVAPATAAGSGSLRAPLVNIAPIAAAGQGAGIDGPGGPGVSDVSGVPLRNIGLLNRMDEDRLPTRPRHLLKLRFTQVRQAKDEKILQLLLICVGFVGVFIAILAMRSMPPSRSAPK
jgi:hypothetical protein